MKNEIKQLTIFFLNFHCVKKKPSDFTKFTLFGIAMELESPSGSLKHNIHKIFDQQ